jgi:hypothetical protein
MAKTLVWAHAVLFGLIALVCYLSPETAIGDSGWLPLARLAVLMFGAALSALVILLVGSVRSGEPRQIKRALLAALVFDLQFPIFIGSQPAWFDYQEADVGMPPFLVWIVFVGLVGVTVYGLRTLQQPERQ